ncbi:RNA polymerase sigma factor (sigma-70 family) [Actinoplanes octamycinicus]|uniref:RNA polymerase sigma factor (Sigma-70 family) n=1 Tax=Actinoplanes octamycinicus TaxID=135948 RepID=A0A7W7H2W0_9ACTN|nr:sigma-70 family RNA polymerase sigma factor [Actinoplanes octamycinicus]MBB4743001.1 RNA polymerase sigma factor (sigma-70 family) [Actinoplanes octamycinicus]
MTTDMGVTRAGASALVRAAQAGDRAALDELAATHLPMVYAIVRQALDGHPDVDDVTQDIMLRALRQLRSLRSPESFRPWLAAIALRQVGTHQHRADRAAAQLVPLDEAAGMPDAEAAFEGVTDLRADLSAQRRQVQRAGRWLDPDDRRLLSLWWLEVAGRLSRAELARALGITVIHAGVRIQRMRAQLELSRAIVAALDVRPRCGLLAGELSGWDGMPAPRWRKRLARHVRDCPICTRGAGEQVPIDRLLPALVLVPVPAALTASVLAKTTGGAVTAAKLGVAGQLAALSAAHPVVTAVAAGTLVVGAVGGAVVVADPATAPPATVAQTPHPTTIPAPTSAAGAGAPASSAPASSVPATSAPAASTPPTSAAAGLLRFGPVSLSSANAAGRYVTAPGGYGLLTAVGPDDPVAARRQATFQVVAGLNDRTCFSFRSADGRYLRHASWRLRLNPSDGSALFRGDATFCPQAGQPAGSVLLESSNYPGWFLRHRGDELWVDQFDGSPGFRADGSFLVRPALAD